MPGKNRTIPDLTTAGAIIFPLELGEIIYLLLPRLQIALEKVAHYISQSDSASDSKLYLNEFIDYFNAPIQRAVINFSLLIENSSDENLLLEKLTIILSLIENAYGKLVSLTPNTKSIEKHFSEDVTQLYLQLNAQKKRIRTLTVYQNTKQKTVADTTLKERILPSAHIEQSKPLTTASVRTPHNRFFLLLLSHQLKKHILMILPIIK